MEAAVATRTSWKTEPMPTRKARIQLAFSCSLLEYQLIARGFVPQEMEDKWFVFLENDTLYCHRSWTGFCIYEVRFARQGNEYGAVDCWVNRDPAQYQGMDQEEDADIIGFLIDRLLLGKPGRVGMRAPSDGDAALRMWSMFGEARANNEPILPRFKVIDQGSPQPSKAPQGRQRALEASSIRDLRAAANDEKTQELTRKFRQLREERDPFYLTRKDLDPVFRWKLRSQYGRVRKKLEQNSDERFQVVTRLAFSIALDDKDLELELRTAVLTTLRGVGVPVASAILALVEPENYCVIDFRVWRQMFGEDRRAFEVGHYKDYVDQVRKLAAELGWTPQETDAAIWERDRRFAKRSSGHAPSS